MPDDKPTYNPFWLGGSDEAKGPPPGLKPGDSWTDNKGVIHFVPGYTPEQQATEASQGQWAGADNFAARMHSAALQNPYKVDVSHAQIDAARQLAAGSYAQQQQAAGMMQNLAQGGGPSVAGIQGQMAQDEAMRQMMGPRGGSAIPAMMSAAPQEAANQAALARQQEIGGYQQGLAQTLGGMRGQSLQDYGMGMQNAQQAKALYMEQQRQNLQRRMEMERLSQQGYQMSASAKSDLENAMLGIHSDRVARDAQMMNAYTQAGAGAAQGLMNYGRNADTGPSHWGSGDKQTDLMSYGRGR